MFPEPIQFGGVRERDFVAVPLSHPHRRRALHILRETGTSLALADLGIEMARREMDDCAGKVRWERARQYHIMLYHCHAPKLAEAGLVDYDADQQTVAPVEPPAGIEM